MEALFVLEILDIIKETRLTRECNALIKDGKLRRSKS